MSDVVERLAAMNERMYGAEDECSEQRICDTHGAFTARRFFGSIWTRCPLCSEELEAKGREAAAERERERAGHIWRSRLDRACIPARFESRTFENYTADTEGKARALSAAQRLAEDLASRSATGRCAVFVGRPGTGKTHLAAAIAMHAMRADRTAIFTTVTRLIRRIRDTYNKGSAETESQAVEVFAKPDLLILDEVGVQRGTDDEKLLLFDVLNDRYEARRSTVLLSNLSAQEVKAYLGERVFDRMREDGGQVVVFDWESHRGQA